MSPPAGVVSVNHAHGLRLLIEKSMTATTIPTVTKRRALGPVTLSANTTTVAELKGHVGPDCRSESTRPPNQ